jgi:hypothetical protein
MCCTIAVISLPRKKKQLKSVNKHASHNWKCDHKSCIFSRPISTHESISLCGFLLDRTMKDLIYVSHQFRSWFHNEMSAIHLLLEVLMLLLARSFFKRSDVVVVMRWSWDLEKRESFVKISFETPWDSPASLSTTSFILSSKLPHNILQCLARILLLSIKPLGKQINLLFPSSIHSIFHENLLILTVKCDKVNTSFSPVQATQTD